MVKAARPTRENYYNVLAECISEETLVVTALGNASYLWSKVCDRPKNFYFEDAMGLALPLALGLATAQPDRKVIVVEGDGGLLMHMGALVTVGAVAPKNLLVLLIRNGVHAASGGQVLTNPNLDFAEIGRTMGLPHAENVGTAETFRTAFAGAMERAGPSLLVLDTEPDLKAVMPPVPLNPLRTKQRFSEAIGAPHYISTFFGGGKLVAP